jgi:hypothetical protein
MSANAFYDLNSWQAPSGLTLREASDLFMGRSHTAIANDCKFLGIHPNDGEVAFITEDRALLLYAFYCWRHYNAFRPKEKYWKDCTPIEAIEAGIEPGRDTASMDVREQVMIQVAGRSAERKFRRMYQTAFGKAMKNKINRGMFAA